MPDISSDKVTATTYPPKSLYQSWKQDADDQNLTVSQFIITRVEAGRKELQLDNIANESIQELRQQRSDLQSEIDRLRTRIQELERQLQHSTQTEIIDFIEENPGATSPEIIQHAADSVPARVASLLDILEGDVLERREGGYYPGEDVNQIQSTEQSTIKQEVEED